MTPYLPVGTVLQQRYEILSVIGHGGFGITYLCRCLWSQRDLVLKELFWNGYMTRAGDGMQVKISTPELKARFLQMQERFLMEARTLLRFEEEKSIVRVLDYFQANGTAYLVTEWIDGMTLEQYVRLNGPIPAEKLFRKILPLLDGLEKMHRAGFLHRDISSDNLMLTRDGQLKLVDFGAARDFMQMDPETISRYVKTGYSPREQYANPTEMGAPSDLYALGAVLYRCITGQMPPSSLGRMQKDTILWPSQMGVAIEPSLEAVLQQMMAVEPQARYQSAQSLKLAVEKALPQQRKHPRRKWFWIAASLVVAAGILSILLWPGKRQDPFAGRDTEQFYLEYPAHLTGEERDILYQAAEEAVETFSNGEYTIQTLDQGLLVTIPLEYFQGMAIGEQLEDAVLYQLPYDVVCRYQVQATWQEPMGKNQIRREDLEGEIVLLVTDAGGSYLEETTETECTRQQEILCSRLDALETPYALGILQGTEHQPVIAISPAHLSRSALLILGGDYSTCIVQGMWADASVSPGILDREPLTVLRSEDGRIGVGVTLDTESIVHTLQARGESCLYLSLKRDAFDLFHLPEQIPVAICQVEEAGTPLEFWNFLLEGHEELGEEMAWLAQFWAQCLNGDKYQELFWIESSLLLDAEGNPCWEETPESHFGIQELPSEHSKTLEDLAMRMQADGLDVTQRPGVLRISLHLPASVSMLVAGLEEASRIVVEYGMGDLPGRMQILLWDTAYAIPDPDNAFNLTNQCAFVVLEDRTDGPGKQITASVVGEQLEGELAVLNQAWTDCTFGNGIQKGKLGYALETTMLACGVYATTFDAFPGDVEAP